MEPNQWNQRNADNKQDVHMCFRFQKKRTWYDRMYFLLEWFLRNYFGKQATWSLEPTFGFLSKLFFSDFLPFFSHPLRASSSVLQESLGDGSTATYRGTLACSAEVWLRQCVVAPATARYHMLHAEFCSKSQLAVVAAVGRKVENDQSILFHALFASE